MKNLEAKNEPVIFANSILGNYFLDTFFRVVSPEKSPFSDENAQSELFHYTLTDESNSSTQTNL